MKRLKKIILIIIGLIMYCFALPWVLTVSGGAIIGSLANAFMIGFKKGAIGYDKIIVALKFLQINYDRYVILNTVTGNFGYWNEEKESIVWQSVELSEAIVYGKKEAEHYLKKSPVKNTKIKKVFIDKDGKPQI